VGKVLCSLGTGKQRKLLRLASVTFRRYAKRHDYVLDLHEEVIDRDRPPAWSKVALIRRLLDQYELVLWLDADIVVVRSDRDIADELPADRFMAMVEHTVAGRANPNTGVMVIRASDEARRFFAEVWEQTQYLNHRWWEQAAVMDLLGYDPETGERVRESKWHDRIHWLAKEWNSIRDDSAREPRIRHWPGFTVARRFAEMALATVRAR
jgi:nucleotide-diphospho-sugar transferase